MLHLDNEGNTRFDANKLLYQARDLASELTATIRDSRISKKFIEFDVTIDKNEIEKLISVLSPIGKKNNARHLVEEKIEKGKAIKDGIFYFNEERFWECHEALEGVWKDCLEGEKELVQGIILVAAAFVHYQKHEDIICLSIMKRAMEKLSRSAGNYYEIDVDEFKSRVSKILKSKKISTFEI